MGYTRYYEITGQIDPQKFEKYSQDCKAICDEITKQTGDGLANWEGEDEPEFTPDEVRFNGVGYDRHVLAYLLLAKEYFGENIRVSDGDNGDVEVESMILEFKRDNKINLILKT